MALKFRKKAVLAKMESTYGTDASPTGAANAVLASDIRIEPMQGADVERAHETPYMGNAGTIPVDLHATLSFNVELTGSGAAGTAPAAGPLIRACGLAETTVAGTTVTYNPISDGFESATLYLNIDGTLYALIGARGNLDLVINASGIPMLEFAFTGLWVKPSAAALPTPDYNAWPDPKAASNANTPVAQISGVDCTMRSFKLGLGNQVEGRFLIGKEQIEIVDRSDMIETQIEALPLATLDIWELAEQATKVPVLLTHGTQAGSRITVSAPTAQIQRPGSPVEAQGIKEWPLNFKPHPSVGNDQFTITFS